MRVAQSTVVFGTSSEQGSAALRQRANRAAVSDAIFETTGIPAAIRILSAPEYRAYIEERDAPPF